jgi:biopolymer transport protein ExbB/TolQ
MEFFQFLDANPWVTVAVFAIVQLMFFVHTNLRLNELGMFFPSKKWETLEDENNLTLIAEPDSALGAQDLISEINDYITKTNGAIEYAVIKDKTERKIDSLFEFATSKVSFPTFLGLMGTFFGVYIGLKCFNAGLGEGDGGITDKMVKELIGGIIVSMVTSLVGLLLMTISSIHASRIQKKVDAQKDEFFEFIQMEVIPTLGTNISSSLNRLRSTIGKFEPSFRAVIDEFKDAFRDCTDMFKGTFAENAEVLTKAVAEMGNNMTLINENIQKQDQLLTTLRQKEMVVTLDKFVTAANSFDSVTTSIQKLEEAKERIIASTNTLTEKQESYNQSLEIPTKLVQQINAILDRVTTFESSINALGVNIAQTQLLGNTQINAIEEQLSALKAKHRLVSDYQETQVEELDKIYQDQSKAVKDLSDAFKRVVVQNKDDIEEAMRQFKEAYDTIVRDCKRGVEQKLEEFINALNKNLDVEDANRKLSNLDRLQALEAGLGEIKTALADKTAIADVSRAVREGNAKIDDLARRPIIVQRTASSSTGNSGNAEKHRGIWPFRRK